MSAKYFYFHICIYMHKNNLLIWFQDLKIKAEKCKDGIDSAVNQEISGFFNSGKKPNTTNICR